MAGSAEPQNYTLTADNCVQAKGCVASGAACVRVKKKKKSVMSSRAGICRMKLLPSHSGLYAALAPAESCCCRRGFYFVALYKCVQQFPLKDVFTSTTRALSAKTNPSFLVAAGVAMATSRRTQLLQHCVVCWCSGKANPSDELSVKLCSFKFIRPNQPGPRQTNYQASCVTNKSRKHVPPSLHLFLFVLLLTYILC